jgi:hypothetical protein
MIFYFTQLFTYDSVILKALVETKIDFKLVESFMRCMMMQMSLSLFEFLFTGFLSYP